MLNYLKEDMAFLKAAIQHPLSPKTHVFWHYLLYFNNRAAIQDTAGDYYWPVWFDVDNGVLIRALGLKNSSRLYHYRRALIDRGWVRYRMRQACDTRWGTGAGITGQNGQYALNPFAAGFQEQVLCLDGYPDGIAVWVAGRTGDETVDGKASYYNINPLNTVNETYAIRKGPGIQESLTPEEAAALRTMERTAWGSPEWKKAFRIYVGLAQPERRNNESGTLV